MKTEILLGNEAIGRGLVEAGIHVMTAYPGTPSSEIMPAVQRFGQQVQPHPYCEWSVNEKVAVEVALSAAYTGLRTACAMKQVGLNVALDPVMSAAYIGVKGGMIIISADDPGPHSSQTEQDSRVLACYAKLPVFDPMSPAQAKDLIPLAFELSERHELPVMLRPTMRVCHARQNVTLAKAKPLKRRPAFSKDHMRWAATPGARLRQHISLNQKIAQIAQEAAADPRLVIWRQAPQKSAYPLGILASGVTAALALDILQDMGWDINDLPLPFLQLALPWPLPQEPVAKLLQTCERVLVLEESEPLLELYSPDRPKLLGRMNHYLPSAGELTPQVLAPIIEKTCSQSGLQPARPLPRTFTAQGSAPLRRPNLCAGCSHRAAFFAMRRAFPTGIYPGDIGCYTLGANQGAVDTCHDMGASINFAASLSRCFQMDGQEVPVIATIGDSTFYHSGPAGLINAVYNNARFVLLILDNETTSMTGMQPTPESGLTASGAMGRPVNLSELVKGCGVEYLAEADPYDLPGFISALQKAGRHAFKEGGSPAVIIARHACVAQKPKEAITELIKVEIKAAAPKKAAAFRPDLQACADCGRCLDICPERALTRTGPKQIKVDEQRCSSCRMCAEVCPTKTMQLDKLQACTACGLCLKWFACPGLKADKQGYVTIDRDWCVDCGMCLHVCGQAAIRRTDNDGQ